MVGRTPTPHQLVQCVSHSSKVRKVRALPITPMPTKWRFAITAQVKVKAVIHNSLKPVSIQGETVFSFVSNKVLVCEKRQRPKSTPTVVSDSDDALCFDQKRPPQTMRVR